ncbi:MAG: maleylpyruvate isomerase family mycothiol-dependent enzyme [Acidimicrobiia bacterium]
MTLPREEVVPGLIGELGQFEALVRSLDAKEWQAPSRCGGWTAGDVAGHVIGQLADVASGRFDGLGTPEVTARQVEERRGRTPAELADELAEMSKVADAILGTFDDEAWNGPGPAGGGTLGDGVEALWFDAALHADDIRSAVGRSSDLSTGLKVSISHLATVLTDQGYRPATLALDGFEEYPVSGGGPAITGAPTEFVLVATGRAAPEVLGLDETINVYR